MIAVIGTDNVYIGADQIKDYVKMGYTIYDDEGKKLENPEQYAVDKLVKKIKLK